MSTELFWLTLTTLMTACFWIPYILDRIAVRGVMGALANPSPDLKPQSAWAERAKAAHANAIENLAVFAALVLIANAVGVIGGLVATASIIYFWTRLVHFVVYALGIIAYNMFNYGLPYKGEPMALLFQHIEGKATPLHRLDKDISEDIGLLVGTMMAADIDKRFQSMKDVKDAIRQLI